MAEYKVKYKGQIIRFEAGSDEEASEKLRDFYVKNAVHEFDPAAFDSPKAAEEAVKKLPEYARESVRQKYAEHYVTQERQKEDPEGDGTWNDLGRMAARNLPGGEFLDEGRAWFRSDGDTYDMELALEHERRKQLDAVDRAGVEIPFVGEVDTGDVAKATGFVGGMVVPGVAAGKIASKVAPGAVAAARAFATARPVASGAATGAASGAGWTALESAGIAKGDSKEKAFAALRDAPFGALSGGIFGAAGGRISKYLNKKYFGDPRYTKSAEDLADEAKKNFQKFDDLRLKIDNTTGHFGSPATPRNFAEELQDRLRTILKDSPIYDADVDVKIKPIEKRLQKLTGEALLDMKDIEQVRKLLIGTYSQGSKREKAIVAALLQEYGGVVDDLVTKASVPGAGIVMKQAKVPKGTKPSFQVMRPGELKEAMNALETGRKIWRRMAKTAKVENAIRKQIEAQELRNVGSVDTAYRKAFEKLVKEQEAIKEGTKKGFLAFSDDEMNMMREMMKGTSAQNLARFAGNLDPRSNSLSQYGMVGTTMADPLTGVTIGATGAAGKHVSHRIAENAARRFQAGVSQGVLAPYVPKTQAVARAVGQNMPARLAGSAVTRIVAEGQALDPNQPQAEYTNELSRLLQESERDPYSLEEKKRLLGIK